MAQDFPPAKRVNLADLAAGEDFGVRFSDPDADWSEADPTLVLVPPVVDDDNPELTPDGTTSPDGSECTFTELGAVTENWARGRWQYSYWVLNAGGSRQMLATGTFRVYDAAGETPE